jgi:hypothetical protein
LDVLLPQLAGVVVEQVERTGPGVQVTMSHTSPRQSVIKFCRLKMRT